MSIPGSNLLKKAFRLIAKQQLIYYQAIGRTLNSVGIYVTDYAYPAVILGSFQPLPKKDYAYMGLNLQKEYFTFYVPVGLIGIERDVSSDQISFAGKLYQCQSVNQWINIDGWLAMICVYIGLDPNTPNIFGFNGYSTYPATLNANTNFYNGNFHAGSIP